MGFVDLTTSLRLDSDAAPTNESIPMPQDTTRLNSQPGTRLADLMKMSPLGQAALNRGEGSSSKTDPYPDAAAPAWNKQDRRKDESGDRRVQLFSEMGGPDKAALLDQLKSLGWTPERYGADISTLPTNVVAAIVAFLRGQQGKTQTQATQSGNSHSSFSERRVRRMTEDHRPVHDLSRIVRLRASSSNGTIRAKW